MRRGRFPSATGEHPRTPGCFRTPLRRTRNATVRVRHVTFRRVGSCTGHGPRASATPLPPPRRPPVVRGRAWLGDHRHGAAGAAHGGALRRPGDARRRGRRRAAAGGADRPGRTVAARTGREGGAGSTETAPAHRGRRRGGAPGDPGLAGVGHPGGGSHRARGRRADAGTGTALTGPCVGRLWPAGGRGVGAASPTWVRGGGFPAHHGDRGGNRGRWGRPRPRTAREHGGNRVPPGPIGTCS